MATIGVGASAPDFTKTTQNGDSVTLSQFRGDKAVVLYFYPKDETPGCTAEACSFRDNFEDFVEAGAVVIGVSQDNEKSHKSFAEHHGLPFLLISDGDKGLQKAYGVPKTMGLLPGRVTFVIDRNGTVQHVFNSQLNAKKHVREALDVVRRLSA
ncbi:MAG: peroxiredoxin [Myxococcales bacterium]|nr:peroxiredoxin [Myxococcales bacterium]MDH3482933.1 peroxiredoxin [Myxococcales bacterium]